MKKIVIEVLYPEYNNLYGDRGNLDYLLKKLTDAGAETEVIRTGLFDVPAFTERSVDFLYIGPCTERQQEEEIRRLLPYREALAARMQSEQITLATGNAMELFGQYIVRADKTQVEGLKLLPMHAERFSRLRYNELCLGTFDGIQVVGFKNQLSHSYGDNPAPFLQMQTGTGMHPETKAEGYHSAGFFATYLIGPLLPLNPPLTENLIRRLLPEYTNIPISFEQEAYEKRITELSDPAVNHSGH